MDTTLEVLTFNALLMGFEPGLIPRVMDKIQPDKNGCWLWTASKKSSGYGQYNTSRNKNYNAHRLVYLLHHGEIPAGLELDHLCRVRHCVNPSHLEPVTREENLRRQFAAITHCPRGHEYSTQNTYVHNGHRHCRKCRTRRNRERYRRK